MKSGNGLQPDSDEALSYVEGGDDISEEDEDQGRLVAWLALALEVVRLIVELLG